MSGPRRIQRKRTKGWRMPPGAVYVGRPTLFGNPWAAHELKWLPPAERAAASVSRYREEMTHLGMLSDYAHYVSEDRWERAAAPGLPTMADYARHYLRGRDLACWCPLDRPCHADVLLELANR